MVSDETIVRTWDMVEQLSTDAPVEVKEVERGLDFINVYGDVVYTIYIAGTEA